MGSTCVSIFDGDPPPSSLGFPAALAVAAAIDETLGCKNHARTKWPNDVLIGEAKVAGLLLERVGNAVVVGIGVNLKHAPDLPDRKTTAISDHVDNPDLETFAHSLARHFRNEIDGWRNSGLRPTLDRFEARSIHNHGSHISVHDVDGSRVEGSFAGLDPADGALRLCLADGSNRVIRAGDII